MASGALEVVDRARQIAHPQGEHAQAAVGKGEALVILRDRRFGEHLSQRGLGLAQPAAKLKLVAAAGGEAAQRRVIMSRLEQRLGTVVDREHRVGPGQKTERQAVSLEAVAGQPALSHPFGHRDTLPHHGRSRRVAHDRPGLPPAAEVAGPLPAIPGTQQRAHGVQGREPSLQPTGRRAGVAEADQRVDLSAAIAELPRLRHGVAKQRIGLAVVAFAEGDAIESDPRLHAPPVG